jgi:DNA-binding LytR/AlgR family response regulator
MMSKLSCSVIIDGKVVKAHEMVPLANVIIIDTIELSRNDRRIRIRATDGDYVFNLNGALNVIEDMLTEHGFWRADNSNLINMAHVDKVVDAMFKPEVLFVNTDIRGQIAAIKVRALKKLFPEISIVKNA